MTYSVWNPTTATYDYYEAPARAADAAPPAPYIRGDKIGASPEQAAWPLPGGARKVGKGPLPRGMIAKTGSGLSGLGFLPDFGSLNLVVLAVGGFFLWKALKK